MLEARYSSLLVYRLISKIMKRGKKTVAERIVYDALNILETQHKKEPLSILEQAVKNSTPTIEVKPRRVGGATYQVPVEMRGDRGNSMAIKWLVNSSRARAGKSMEEKLASELFEASQGQGATIKKKEELHKMAEANRAFVHFRW